MPARHRHCGSIVGSAPRGLLRHLRKPISTPVPVRGWPMPFVLAATPISPHLPGFDAGAFSVQDGAAQLAADLLDLRDGLRVLDACAAPGGKSMHVLERSRIELLALDRDAAVCSAYRKTSSRLGLRRRTAARPTPCQPATVVGRSPIRAHPAGCAVLGHRRDPPPSRTSSCIVGPAISRTGRQRRHAHAAWPCGRCWQQGGRLVYATCSLVARGKPGRDCTIHHGPR